MSTEEWRTLIRLGQWEVDDMERQHFVIGSHSQRENVLAILAVSGAEGG